MPSTAVEMWANLRQQFNKQIESELTQDLSLMNFEWVNAGQPGDKYGDMRLKSGVGADTYPILTKQTVDKVNFEGQALDIPWTGKFTELHREEKNTIVKNGIMGAAMEDDMRLVKIAGEKLFWQGKITNGMTIYGVNDAGTSTGTFLRPIYLDGGTTGLVKWGAAGVSMNAINALVSKLKSAGFKRPYALCVPTDGAALLNMPIVTGSGVYADKSVAEYALAPGIKFDQIIWVGNDDEGKCLMTGNAESTTDCQIFGISLPSVKVPYTEMIGSREEIDALTEISTFRIGGTFVPRAKPKKISTSYFKGVVELDACTTAAS
jgi:hypothetical protein